MTNRLDALLGAAEISFDLLWTLFKRQTCMYTQQAIVLDSPHASSNYSGRGGQAATESGTSVCIVITWIKTARISGEAPIQLAVEKFWGTRRISFLEAFHLAWHLNRDYNTDNLMCGRKFLLLQGVHHRQYHGIAYCMRDGQSVKVPVDGGVMINAQYFEKTNPNHPKPQVGQAEQPWSVLPGMCYVWTEQKTNNNSSRVKSKGTVLSRATSEDVVICSPTVPGFSYGNKDWGYVYTCELAPFDPETAELCGIELTLADVEDMSWNE